MRKLLVGLCFVAGPAMASPFVVSDALAPSSEGTFPTHCGYQIDGDARVDFPVVAAGTDVICKVDLSGISNGKHDVNLTAVIIDPVWGRLESAPSPNFTFVKPGITGVPSGLKLQQ